MLGVKRDQKLARSSRKQRPKVLKSDQKRQSKAAKSGQKKSSIIVAKKVAKLVEKSKSLKKSNQKVAKLVRSNKKPAKSDQKLQEAAKKKKELSAAKSCQEWSKVPKGDQFGSKQH